MKKKTNKKAKKLTLKIKELENVRAPGIKLVNRSRVGAHTDGGW